MSYKLAPAIVQELVNEHILKGERRIKPRKGKAIYPADLDRNKNDFVQFAHGPYKINDELKKGGGPTEGLVIQMYMPNSTPGVGNEQNYELSTFAGEVGQFQKQMAQLGGGMLAPGHNQAYRRNGTAPFPGHFRQANVGEITKQKLLEEYTRTINTDPTTATAMANGMIYNPNVEMIYRGPNVRTFNFTFDMVPKDESDRTAVDRIISEFKLWSTPEITEHHITVPHLWYIKYFGPSGVIHPFMNKFKPCVLAKFQYIENPSPMNYHMTHTDLAPVHTRMTLSFEEVMLVSRMDHATAGVRGF